MAIDAIIGGISAIGEAAAAAAPEVAAAAAPEVAAAAVPEIAGAVLPEIVVEAAAPEIAAGVGTEAALGGAAALGTAGAAEAALAGGAGIAGLTAADIAAGAIAAPELAAGVPADLTGGAVPGAPAVPTTAVAPPVVTTPAGGLPATGAGVSPTEALSGTTGPLAALQPTTGTPFETLWSETAGMAPAQPATAAIPPDVTPPGALPAAGEFPSPSVGNVFPGVETALNQGGATMSAGSWAGTPPMIETAGLGPGGGALSESVNPIAGVTGEGASTVGAGGGSPEFGGGLGRAMYSGGQFQGIEGVAPAASAAPSGILGTGITAGQALSGIGPFASLGMLGYNLMRGPQPLPAAEQQALQNVSPGSPVYQTAQRYMTEASTGQLQPGEIAQIQQYQQNATNQLFQQLANEGVTNPQGDSRFVQGQQAIYQNSQIMYQQFINAAVTNGLAAQGAVDQTLQSAAQMQVQNDQAFQQSLVGATQAFALTSVLASRAA
jgi:hypothetical protein